MPVLDAQHAASREATAHVRRAPCRRQPRPRGHAASSPATILPARPRPRPGTRDARARRRAMATPSDQAPASDERGVPGRDDDGDPHGYRRNCRSRAGAASSRTCPFWLLFRYQPEKLPGGRTRPGRPYGSARKGRAWVAVDTGSTRTAFLPIREHSTHGRSPRSPRDRSDAPPSTAPGSRSPRPSSRARRRSRRPTRRRSSGRMEVIRDFHPALVRGVQRRACARSTRRPSRTRAGPSTRSAPPSRKSCCVRWQTDPVLKAPLAAGRARLQVRALRPARGLRHDGRQAQRRAGARAAALALAGAPRRRVARRRDRVRRRRRRHGRRRRRRRARARRARATPSCSSRRASTTGATRSTGSAVDAHQRFYRGAFSVGNSPMPIFMGRLVGGSTAINGGTSLPHAALGARALVRGDRHRRVLARRDDAATSSASSASSRSRRRRATSSAPSPTSWRAAATRSAGATSPSRATRPGCDGKGFCDFGCRTDARLGHEPLVRPGRARARARSCSRARASSSVLLEGGRARRRRGRHAHGRKVRVRARAVILAGRRDPDAAAPAQAGARQRERPGRAQPQPPPEHRLRRRRARGA